MRRLTIVTAVTTVLLPLVAALPGQTAVAAAAEGDQPVGPGQYFSDAKTFEISEIDAAAGAIGCKHGVAAVDGALAQPKAVPASRVDLSVFGPGWQAEFLGGMTGRKLETQSGAVLVTGATIRAIDPAPLTGEVTIAPGGTRTLAPAGTGGIPSSGVSAVGLTVAARGSADGAVVVVPAGSASGVRVVAYGGGKHTVGSATAALRPDGTIVLKNEGTSQVTVSVGAYAYFGAR
ncbi:hypothetical protein JYK22_36055, partial [Nonomuraea sp. RK-328]|nr:hypothetical protein [Nonomuraea sp. RK-328]